MPCNFPQEVQVAILYIGFIGFIGFRVWGLGFMVYARALM